MVFFFFFGGVSQEVQAVLKSEVETCPVCKSPASVVEYANVLRVFFLPVWKWGGDNPAVKCTSCPFLMPVSKLGDALGRTRPAEMAPKVQQCWSCSSPLDSVNFNFCPYCGASL